MYVLPPTSRLFKPDDADAVARAVRADDPDWEYVVRHDPLGTGWSFVEIYDEDGILVGCV